jgi:hypothetical protein
LNPFTCRNQTPLGPPRYRFSIRVQNHKRSRDNKKLETEIPTTESYQDFLFAINSPVTRERYSTRLRSFFVYIGIEGTTMEERCRKFVERVKESEENGNSKFSLLTRTENPKNWLQSCILYQDTAYALENDTVRNKKSATMQSIRCDQEHTCIVPY